MPLPEAPNVQIEGQAASGLSRSNAVVRLFARWFEKKCHHEFDLAHLRATGIPAPEKPEKNDYESWKKGRSEFYESDHVKKRVMWSCRKCGKTFYAHCGLDIYKHGAPIP
jgi:hypothetical protein